MATSHRHLENHKKIADITIHLNALKHVYDNKKMRRYNIKKKTRKIVHSALSKNSNCEKD